LAAAIDNERRLREAPGEGAAERGCSDIFGGRERVIWEAKRKRRGRDKVEYRRLDMTMNIKRHF
jgi:hypothetical protein